MPLTISVKMANFELLGVPIKSNQANWLSLATSKVNGLPGIG